MNGRKKDVRGEKALGLFLDKYFYPRLLTEEAFASIERIYSIDQQKSGIDLKICDKQGRSLKVDEKAQLRYINHPTNTFAFELSFFNGDSKNLMDGWFINETNVTDCYILCWINRAKTDQLNRITAEDFEEVEIYLIVKKRLQDYLNNAHITRNYLKKVAIILREDSSKDRMDLIKEVGYLTQSHTDDGEEPINLVIKKEILKGLAYRRYLNTKESLVKF